MGRGGFATKAGSYLLCGNTGKFRLNIGKCLGDHHLTISEKLPHGGSSKNAFVDVRQATVETGHFDTYPNRFG